MSYRTTEVPALPSKTEVITPSEFEVLPDSMQYQMALYGYLREGWREDPSNFNITYLRDVYTGLIYASVKRIPPTEWLLLVVFTPEVKMDLAGPSTIWRWVGVAGIGAALLFTGMTVFGKKKR
jgi:hypothetical protein